MQLIDVVPKDIHFIFDISFEDLRKLKHVMDHCEIQLNLNDKYNIDSQHYVLDVFYKNISEAVKGVEGDKS